MNIPCNLPDEFRWLSKRKSGIPLRPIVSIPILNPTTDLTLIVCPVQGGDEFGVDITDVVLMNNTYYSTVMNSLQKISEAAAKHSDWKHSTLEVKSDKLIKRFAAKTVEKVYNNGTYCEWFYSFLYKDVYYVSYIGKHNVVFTLRLNESEMSKLTALFERIEWNGVGSRETFWELILSFPNTLYYANLTINQDASNVLVDGVGYEVESLKTSTAFGNPMLYSMADMVAPPNKPTVGTIKDSFCIVPHKQYTPVVLIHKLRGYYVSSDNDKNVDKLFTKLSSGIRSVQSKEILTFLQDRLHLWLDASLSEIVIQHDRFEDSLSEQLLPTMANSKGLLATTDVRAFKTYLLKGLQNKQTYSEFAKILYWINFEDTDPKTNIVRLDLISSQNISYIQGKREDFYVPLQNIINKKHISSQQWDNLKDRSLQPRR